MKQMKRILSLALALVMVLGIVPATVLAAEATPALPTAAVSEISNEELTFAMNFRVNSVTEEQLAYYGGWYADFELTVNKEVSFNNDGSADGWLAGQYDEWSENWVTVPFGNYAPVTLEAGETVKIMAFAADMMGEPGLKYTFREVYEGVKDFDCGVYFDDEFLLANPDLVVTLELKMYNPENESESYVIGETYTYTNPIVAKNTATNKTYATIADAMLDCAEGQTVVLLKDTTETIVSIFDSMTLDLNGHTLVASYVSGFGDIIDSSVDNAGVLTVPANRIMIREDNTQVPIREGNGYRFAEIYKFEAAYREDLGKFGLRPYVEADMLELLKQGSEATGVTIQVKITWKQDAGYRTQNFVYSDEQLRIFLNSYNAATQSYGKLFTLTVKGAENYDELSFTAMVVSETKVAFTPDNVQEQKPAGNVTTNAQNQVVNDVTIGSGNASALVPSGTQLESGANNVTLSATEMEKTTSNITLSDDETMVSMNVHVDGVAADNTTPIIVTLTNVAIEGLNQGNLTLYHVENGETVEMTRVYSLAEVDAHNEYYYDIATGTITMALATFSEVALVANEINPWQGKIDTSWYDAEKTSFEIYNADQLAGLGELVDEGNTFDGKTILLGFDINLGGEEGGHSFDPIGYGYEHDGGKVFKGTFDGQGHTIRNLYQNGWALGLSYSTAGGGLFASVVNAEFKNLTLDKAYVVMECIDMGVLVGYAYGTCRFENIIVSNSVIANYNRYTGGVVGEVNGNHTFINVDVPASTTISSLWGSFDTPIGGIIGGKYGAATVYMERCDVAAVLDVFNDVTSAYRWYSYRRAGMLIGHTEETRTVNGRTEAKASFLTTIDCTVQYGDWAKYHYCQFSNENYPYVRVEAGLFNEAYSNPRYGNPVGADGTTKINADNHDSDIAHKEGEDCTLPVYFHQLYGGGQGCYGGNQHVEDNLGVTELTDVTAEEKFTAKVDAGYSITPGKTYTLGELFAASGLGQAIQNLSVNVYVSPVEVENVGNISGIYVRENDWTQSTITLSGSGYATITINDYYYCTPTVLVVNVGKTNPSYTVPSGLTATYGDTLADVELPDGFTWKDAAASVGNAGVNTFVAIYTPEDTDKYNTVEVNVTVAVAKADPSYELPTNLTATYGDTLADVTLPEGFAWLNDSASVGNAGTNSFTVIYTPADTANYNTAELTVSVTVAKANPSYTVPTGLTAKYDQTLADVTLPNGFTWKDAATTSVGSVGTNRFIAIYTPADIVNYNTVEVEVEIEVTRDPVVKFESKFTGDFLYRVGNQNAVNLGSLFKEKDDVTIGTVAVTVENVDGSNVTWKYTSNATWTSGTLKFEGTGVVKVTITDDDYCIPTELYLEVVDAVNATTATSATSNNVVLLNDIGSGFTVSGDYTFYGNGFALNYTGNGQYLRNGLTHGVIEITENGTLDNLRIKATIYPKAYLYYGTNSYGEAAQDGPSDGNERYYYQLSAVAVYGNATISNCYIYGGRNNIYASTGNITIRDTILECGVVSNLQIQSTNEYTVTLENVTTIQKQVNPTIGDTSLVMLGAGVLVGPETSSNPIIVLNGEFKQYNWVTADDKNAVSDTMAQAIIGGALDATAYNHTVNGKTSSNLGIIYMNTHDAEVINNTGLPYEHANVTLKITSVNQNITGQAYSLQNAAAAQIYSDIENADRNTVNGDYLPTLDFDLGNQAISYDGSEDTRYLYGDADGVTALYQDGDDPLTLDLTKLATIYKYTGCNYPVTVVCKDANGNELTATNGVVTLSAQGSYTLVFTVDDNIFYDKNGTTVEKSVSRTYTVTLTLTVKEADVKNATITINSTTLSGVYETVNLTDYKLRINFLDCISITDYDNTGAGTTVDLTSNISSATLAPDSVNVYTTAFTVTITYTDGRVLTVNFSKISGSSPGSPKTATVNTSGGVYIITDSALDNKPTESSSQNTCTITSVSYKGNSGSTVTDDTDVTVTWDLGSSSSGGGSCLAAGTMITLADGSKKPVEDIRRGDLVMAFDHITGKLTFKDVIIVVRTYGEFYKNTFVFDDGTELATIIEHGIYDLDLQKYVNIDHLNWMDYVGHRFVSIDANGNISTKKLVNVITEWTEDYKYDIVTNETLNYVAEDTLSVTHVLVDVINTFAFNENMVYDQEQMQADIEKYGLYTYDEWEEYCDISVFDQYNIPVMKVGISKGLYTQEYIVGLINTYVLNDDVQILN